MSKIKVLNLYAGLGGNRKDWPENFEVTAVEKDPKIAAIYKRFFPHDTVIVTDAHAWLLKHAHDYDFIWSSPPCQTHSQMNKATRHVGKLRRYPDMKLYQEIIWLKSFFKGFWVVENVDPYYEPLIPAQLVDRHLFWSNFFITPFKVERPFALVKGKREEVMNWLGMHFDEKIYVGDNHCPVQILRNCVHPKLGAHVLSCAYKEKQQTLQNF